MPNYKDQEGNVHFIEDDKYKDLLHGGCVKISDGEAAILSEAKEKEREDIDKVEKAKVDLLWQEFNDATTIASLKAVLEKILGRC